MKFSARKVLEMRLSGVIPLPALRIFDSLSDARIAFFGIARERVGHLIKIPFEFLILGENLTEEWGGVTRKKAWKNGVNEKANKGKFPRVGGEFQRWEHLKNALGTRRKSH